MIDAWRKWVKEIARIVKKHLPGSQVYLIGSIARGDYIGASDVDILVVVPVSESPKGILAKAKIKSIIEEELKLPYYHPFEIHIVTPSEAVFFMRRGKVLVVEEA